MAAPTAPTLTEITTYGLQDAGISSPSAAQITRAERYVEEVKNDIYTLAPKLKSLYTTSYAVCTIGINRYANPTDFGTDMTLSLMDGIHTGTAQTGTTGSVTLAADEDVSRDFILGKYILMTSGTSKASCSEASDYSTSSKVSAVTPNFTTAPVGGDDYMIADIYWPLAPGPVWNMDRLTTPTVKGRPTAFMPTGSSTNGEFMLDCPADKAYGLQMRYYANLMKLDLAGDLMATLYQKWRNVFQQGVMAKQMKFDDDNRATAELQVYYNMIQSLVMRETYGNELSNLGCTVRDF